MAKDNVPFHTVVFPATLLGTKEPYTMLNSINATGKVGFIYWSDVRGMTEGTLRSVWAAFLSPVYSMVRSSETPAD